MSQFFVKDNSSAAPDVETLTGNSGGAIGPDAAFNINTVGTGSITTAGAGNTLTAQLTGLTNYNVLIGAGTATITKVAPSATVGVALVSAGAAVNPAFGTTVVAGGGTGATTLTGIVTGNGIAAFTANTVTENGVLIGGASNAASSLGVATTGTLLIGATAAAPAFGSSASADFTFTSATAGATRTFTVSNTDNTNAASTALVQTTVGGGTAGDPIHTFTVTGGSSWSHGIDNSTSDSWKLSQGTAIGTNDVIVATTAGEITYPLQPAFLALLGSDVANATGNGAAWTLGTTTALTEIFDQNSDFNTNGTFTSPVTGRYQLNAKFRINAVSSAMTSAYIQIITSNRTLTANDINPGAASTISGFTGYISMAVSILLDMDAADTATTLTQLFGGVGNTATIVGGATVPDSSFSGNLEC